MFHQTFDKQLRELIFPTVLYVYIIGETIQPRSREGILCRYSMCWWVQRISDNIKYE